MPSTTERAPGRPSATRTAFAHALAAGGGAQLPVCGAGAARGAAAHRGCDRAPMRLRWRWLARARRAGCHGGRRVIASCSTTARWCRIPLRASSPRTCTARASCVDPTRTLWQTQLARPAVGRDRALRAARRHVHARRHVSRCNRQARSPGRARRHGARDHAGRRLSRDAATGATTACCLYAPDASYGRPDDFKRARRRRACARASPCCSTWSTTTSARRATTTASSRRSSSPSGTTRPWGAAINYRRRRQRARARVLRRERAVLARRVPPRRAAARCRACDSRRQRACTCSTSSPQRVRELDHGSAAFIWCSRTRRTRPHRVVPRWQRALHRAMERRRASRAARRGDRRERTAYYGEYRGRTQLLARALAEGFAFQGEVMQCRGRPRGEPSAQLPPTAFVSFIQNHDQIGNRAFGERIGALAPPAAAARGGRGLPAGAADSDALHGRGMECARSPSCSSAISMASWPKPCATGGARNSSDFRSSPIRSGARRIPDPQSRRALSRPRSCAGTICALPAHAAHAATGIGACCGAPREDHAAAAPASGAAATGEVIGDGAVFVTLAHARDGASCASCANLSARTGRVSCGRRPR